MHRRNSDAQKSDSLKPRHHKTGTAQNRDTKTATTKTATQKTATTKTATQKTATTKTATPNTATATTATTETSKPKTVTPETAKPQTATTHHQTYYLLPKIYSKTPIYIRKEKEKTNKSVYKLVLCWLERPNDNDIEAILCK